MNKRLTTAIGALLIVIVAVVAYVQWSKKKPVVVLKGAVGGEKMDLMEDPKLKDLLHDKYALEVQVEKRGSIEMVEKEDGQHDFLFPGSQLETEMFRDRKGGMLKQSETILNSPLVIYSWDAVADALVKQGIAAQTAQGYYTVDLPKLVKLITDGKKWSELGVNSVYGTVVIATTDPNYSNSGAMFSGLLANVLLGEGAVASDDSIDRVLPAVKSFYAKMGFMERSSRDLFQSYLTTGEGAKPLVVGYENQMVEFALESPDIWNKHKNEVRVLYPVPTVWSVHQLLALNDKAKDLTVALSDPDAQKIAWERHGFRSGQSGTANDTRIMGNIGIPERIDKVVPIPNAATMNRILAALK